MCGQPSTLRAHAGVAPAHRPQPAGAVIATPAGSRSARAFISCSVCARWASVMTSGLAGVVVAGALVVVAEGDVVALALEGVAAAPGAADVRVAGAAAPSVVRPGTAEPTTEMSRKKAAPPSSATGVQRSTLRRAGGASRPASVAGSGPRLTVCLRSSVAPSIGRDERLRDR